MAATYKKINLKNVWACSQELFQMNAIICCTKFPDLQYTCVLHAIRGINYYSETSNMWLSSPLKFPWMQQMSNNNFCILKFHGRRDASLQQQTRCIPTHSSLKPRYLKIRCRDASRLLLPLLLLFVYTFWPYHPYLLFQLFCVAFYTCHNNIPRYHWNLHIGQGGKVILIEWSSWNV